MSSRGWKFCLPPSLLLHSLSFFFLFFIISHFPPPCSPTYVRACVCICTCKGEEEDTLPFSPVTFFLISYLLCFSLHHHNLSSSYSHSPHSCLILIARTHKCMCEQTQVLITEFSCPHFSWLPSISHVSPLSLSCVFDSHGSLESLTSLHSPSLAYALLMAPLCLSHLSTLPLSHLRFSPS